MLFQEVNDEELLFLKYYSIFHHNRILSFRKDASWPISEKFTSVHGHIFPSLDDLNYGSSSTIIILMKVNLPLLNQVAGVIFIRSI